MWWREESRRRQLWRRQEKVVSPEETDHARGIRQRRRAWSASRAAGAARRQRRGPGRLPRSRPGELDRHRRPSRPPVPRADRAPAVPLSWSVSQPGRLRPAGHVVAARDQGFHRAARHPRLQRAPLGLRRRRPALRPDAAAVQRRVGTPGRRAGPGGPGRARAPADHRERLGLRALAGGDGRSRFRPRGAGRGRLPTAAGRQQRLRQRLQLRPRCPCLHRRDAQPEDCLPAHGRARRTGRQPEDRYPWRAGLRSGVGPAGACLRLPRRASDAAGARFQLPAAGRVVCRNAAYSRAAAAQRRTATAQPGYGT